MKLFREIKQMVKETYSTAARHFKPEFKLNSIEGFVRINSKIYEKFRPIQKNNSHKAIKKILDEMFFKSELKINKKVKNQKTVSYKI